MLVPNFWPGIGGLEEYGGGHPQALPAGSGANLDDGPGDHKGDGVGEGFEVGLEPAVGEGGNWLGLDGDHFEDLRLVYLML